MGSGWRLAFGQCSGAPTGRQDTPCCTRLECSAQAIKMHTKPTQIGHEHRRSLAGNDTLRQQRAALRGLPRSTHTLRPSAAPNCRAVSTTAPRCCSRAGSTALGSSRWLLSYLQGGGGEREGGQRRAMRGVVGAPHCQPGCGTHDDCGRSDNSASARSGGLPSHPKRSKGVAQQKATSRTASEGGNNTT